MNCFKKLTLFFLCAVFLLNDHVNASELISNNKIIINAETVLYSGSEKVRLDISTDFPASGIQFVLEYDKTVLEYSSGEISETISDYNDEANTVLNHENGLRIVLIGDLDSGTEGKWISLFFDPISGVSGSAEFSLNSIKAVSKTSEYIECCSEPCSVTVNAILYGDVNGDREVNIKDIVRLKKYFAKISDLVESNADLNGDAEITAEDMTELKKLLLLSD